MSEKERWRWNGAVLLTFATAAWGIALGRPLLFVAGAVPLTYVAYGYLSGPPRPELAFERHIEAETAVPGERVTVRLEVHNEGDGVVSDVRVVDGVPGPLPVVEGEPRTAVPLPPGGSTAFEYTVRARRGIHEFDDVRLQLRSLTGGHVVTETRSATGVDRLRCLQHVSMFPLPDQTRQYVGRAPADEGGEGVEFYGSREYLPSDPAKRINWHRLAATGELTTVVHREERSRSVVFVLDARPAAAVGSGEGTFTAVELGTYAIERGTRALQEDNHSVGLAVVGDGAAGPSFVAPGGGTATRERIRHVLSRVGPFVADALDSADTEDATPEDPAADAAGASGELTEATDGGGVDPVQRLLADVGTDAQVVLVSPLLDRDPVELVERLTKRGYVTTVLSPDVTGDERWGSRLAALDRHAWRRRAESLGAPVIDWDPEESLGMTLARAVTGPGRGTEVNDDA
ncbi:MAG: DUF58 domain-containing protein [Haloquadratum sp.]